MDETSREFASGVGETTLPQRLNAGLQSIADEECNFSKDHDLAASRAAQTVERRIQKLLLLAALQVGFPAERLRARSAMRVSSQ